MLVKMECQAASGSPEIVTETTTNMHNTWFDTGIPCSDVVSICAISTSYQYVGYFGLVNGVLTWLDGIDDTGSGSGHGQFFQIDTSGSTLKIKSNYGGNGIHNLYIVKK